MAPLLCLTVKRELGNEANFSMNFTVTTFKCITVLISVKLNRNWPGTPFDQIAENLT